MKTQLLMAGLLASSVTWAAQPDVDLERIGKDLGIMTQIVTSALEDAKVCRDCSDQVQGRYLAEQGAVINVTRSRTMIRYLAKMEGDTDLDYEIELAELPEIPAIPDLPVVVHDALSRINIDIDGDGDYFSFGMSNLLDTDTRREMRDVERERRRIEEQLRDVEIEMIHAEEEERRTLEKQLQSHREQLDKVRADHARLEDIVTAKRVELEKKREARREALEAQDAEQLQTIERVMFEAVCDYGSTLKGIPNDERVTLVLASGRPGRTSGKSSVYVLAKRDVSNCEVGDWEKLRGKAIAYEF